MITYIHPYSPLSSTSFVHISYVHPEQHRFHPPETLPCRDNTKPWGLKKLPPAMASESLTRTAIAMAVRLGSPRAHALTLLRCPCVQKPYLLPQIRVPTRTKWQRILHTSFPSLLSKPYSLPTLSAAQDITIAKPRTGGAGGFSLDGEALEFTSRTHECGKLSEKDVGVRVRVCGWVASQRSHGAVAFVNMRDHTGIVQVLFPRKLV